ncbi:MAG: hypothetical protein PHO75_04365 [Candidatus Shapirobacteria bacterium]|nr:hypothetical protein [Candidatus Shapirobacteria bacterium]
MEDGVRKPQSGVDIRLIRPGADWQNGIRLAENHQASGYYECIIETEQDCGFYELWDDRGNTNGSFSGKTCTIGKLNARGLQNNCIYGNHLLNGVITGSKLANGSVSANHLGNSVLSLSKIIHELQDQNNGIGDQTQSCPASIRDDRFISHKLDKEYDIIPHVILTNLCNCFLYIADIKQDGTQITITIGIGQVFDAPEAKYQLIALPY